MTEAYPLYWPDGWPRTKSSLRKWSLAGGRRNTQSWDTVLRRIRNEVERIGGKGVVISTDQPLRQEAPSLVSTRYKNRVDPSKQRLKEGHEDQTVVGGAPGQAKRGRIEKGKIVSVLVQIV